MCQPCRAKVLLQSHKDKARLKSTPPPPGHKWCALCRKSHPIEIFSGFKACPSCRDEHRARSRRNYAERTKRPVCNGVRRCIPCNREFPTESFGGFRLCRECRDEQREWSKKYTKKYSANIVLDGKKHCPACHALKPISYFGGRKVCISCRAKTMAKWHARTEQEKAKYALKKRSYFLQYPDVTKSGKKRRSSYNPTRYKIWAIQNRKRLRAVRRRRVNIRMRTDPHYRMSQICRDRIRKALQRQFTEKSKRTIELLGCDWKTLKEHIESQFVSGMTWDGIFSGKIEIDHIVPCAAFNLADVEQQKACFNYRNLQPLFADDNAKKSDKMPWEIAA